MTSADDVEADAARVHEDPAAHSDRVSWRQLGERLWVGHDGTTSVGTIEQGARYVFIDADGAVHPGVRSLRDAQVLATGPIRLPMTPAEADACTRTAAPTAGARARLVPLVRSTVLVTAFLLALVAVWMIGHALLGA